MPPLRERLAALPGIVVRDLQQQGKTDVSTITRLEVDGGHSLVQVATPRFGLNELSPPATRELAEVCDALLARKNAAVADGAIARESVQGALLGSLIRSFLSAALLNPPDPMAALGRVAAADAARIDNWSSLPRDQFHVRVRLYPEVDDPMRGTNVGAVAQWTRSRPSNLEMSIAAHQSGMTASEFLSRLQQSSHFVRPLQSFPNWASRDSVVQHIEMFILALCLGLRCPFRLDNVELVSTSWDLAPLAPFGFQRRWGAYRSLGVDAGTVQFFSTVIGRGLRQITNYQAEATEWLTLLEGVPGALFPLRTIMDGIWNILAGHNDPSFTPQTKAKEGALQICIGMDGLIRMTEGGVTEDHRGKFQRAWKPIARTAGPLPGAASSDSIVEKIYQLRCVLAHGGVDRVSTAFATLKRRLGNNYNPGDVSPLAAGLLLAAWSFHVLDVFRRNPGMLRDLYDSAKNRRDTNKYLLRKIKYQAIDLLGSLKTLAARSMGRGN